MRLLLLRPYYGVTVHSDMQGDLGVAEYLPQVFPDLSLVYAATIANNDESVALDVIDANAEKLFPKDVLVRMNKNYDVIILKAAAPTIKFDIEFLRFLKMRFPRTKLVISGHVVKILREWILENAPEIDEVADVPVEHYVNNIINKKVVPMHINEFPTPNYSLFPYEKYVYVDGEKRACIHMSRGCAVGCKYCPYASFYGKKFEFRSVDKVINDIKYLLSIGVSTIQFRDQYFAARKDTVYELCNRIIDEGLKFKWRCETRLESLDIELIDLMIRSGMDMICFGVESASKKTLENFDRPVYEVDKIKKLVKYLNDRNVDTLAFFIIGFPEDTWDTIKETYDLSVELGSIYSKFSIYMPSLTDEDFIMNNSNIEITPDLFVPFENTLNINASKHFSSEELRFLVDQVTLMHQTQSSGLKKAFEFHYIYQTRYLSMIDKLRTDLENISLLKIGHVKVAL